MALLQDLIQQIDDPALKERILQETNKLLKQKKFGLGFMTYRFVLAPRSL